MHQPKEKLPVRIDSPGAVARQLKNFGSVSGYGEISGEFFTMRKGTDITPLLAGLPGDLCQCPHWGYLLEGALTVRFASGEEEYTTAGELFYWPPGHTVRVDEDAQLVLFSPAHEHSQVLEHMAAKMGG